MRGNGKEQARSRQTMKALEYREPGTGKDRGEWRDKDRGMSMGGMKMQSREATLTNSNQRASMGTCGELASAGTSFSQRHSHNCTANAVWAGRTLSPSHKTWPCSRTV